MFKVILASDKLTLEVVEGPLIEDAAKYLGEIMADIAISAEGTTPTGKRRGRPPGSRTQAPAISTATSEAGNGQADAIPQ